MGILDHLISNAVSGAVGKGIGKGITDAVGKAVENAVKPAADKLAGQAASHLNQATQNLSDSAEAAQTASQAAAAPAFPTEEGAASLGSVLSGWATAMQDAAGRVAQNMKECPQCGEVLTADHKFCPKCGTKLPEKTLGEGYLCPNCGKQNVPGTIYCAECGALLPAAEAEKEAQLQKWDALLPQYPKWTLGGQIELEAGGEVNGRPAVSLHVGGAGAALLQRYVELLRAEGFVPVYDGDSYFYYKMVDGVCRAFDKTDADQGDFLSMTFFVGDFDKRKAVKESAAPSPDIGRDAAKAAADAAKGLFRKFF